MLKEEDTPLHKALWQGNVKIVKALQHCGADVNAANVVSTCVCVCVLYVHACVCVCGM